jgi:hypothetical protein
MPPRPVLNGACPRNHLPSSTGRGSATRCNAESRHACHWLKAALRETGSFKTRKQTTVLK